MAAQIPSTPDVLFLSLQAQVMTSMSLGVECVLLSTGEEEDEQARAPRQAETVVFLHVGDGAFDPGQTAAAGRFAVVDRLGFSASLWTRLLLDEPGRDDARLTDPTLGHLVRRTALVNALALFQPVDSQDDWLVSEPVKPLRSSRPRTVKGKPGWIRSAVDFVMPYELVLDQTYQ